MAWGDTASEKRQNGQLKADLLVTSPPYGDNATTVPYGQHAFLPLQWIDLDDIDSGISPELLANTHAIDSRSLGGLRSGALEEVEAVCRRSKSLTRLLERLRVEPRDRALRVAAFWRDLDKCLFDSVPPPSDERVHGVGRRRTKSGQPSYSHAEHSRGTHREPRRRACCVLERRIPSKRMAVRNDISETMVCERVLIMRKGAC